MEIDLDYLIMDSSARDFDKIMEAIKTLRRLVCRNAITKP